MSERAAMSKVDALTVKVVWCIGLPHTRQESCRMFLFEAGLVSGLAMQRRVIALTVMPLSSFVILSNVS